MWQARTQLLYKVDSCGDNSTTHPWTLANVSRNCSYFSYPPLTSPPFFNNICKYNIGYLSFCKCCKGMSEILLEVNKYRLNPNMFISGSSMQTHKGYWSGCQAAARDSQCETQSRIPGLTGCPSALSCGQAEGAGPYQSHPSHYDVAGPWSRLKDELAN